MAVSRGTAVVIVCSVFTGLAVLSVAARLVARLFFLKNGGRDELAIVASLICSLCLLASTTEQTKHGLGRHWDTLEVTDIQNMMKMLWVSIMVYNFSLAFTKASIILQYLRVFVGKKIRLSCWATLALVAAYGCSSVLSGIFSCKPISAFWAPGPGSSCVDKQFLWFFNAAFNILSDLIIIIVPMPALSSLNLPLKQKMGLMVIFALGGFAVLVSILRLHSLYIISKSLDPSWDNVDTAIWSDIEINIGIICASLPTIKPLISRLFPHLLSSRTTHPSSHNTPHQRSFLSSELFNSNAVRLTDIDSSHKTITRVECGRSEADLESASGDEGSAGKGKDIFMLTSITQDVERKDDMGSEKDLIFRRN